MTPKLLIKCGSALFPGKNWKSGLAKALGVDKMTIRRWADGDYPVPDNKAQEIFNLVRFRRDALHKLVGD